MKVQVPNSPRARVMQFLNAYRDAPSDADIEIRRSVAGTVDAVCVSINGKAYGLLADEARILADIFEEQLQRDQKAAEAEGFVNIIMGLRMGADSIPLHQEKEG